MAWCNTASTGRAALRSRGQAGLARPHRPRADDRARCRRRMPDQGPATPLTASIDHRSPAPELGQDAVLRQHQTRRPVRRYFRPPRIRPAACAINASTCSGAAPLATSTHSSAPRNVSIAASKASNRSMASVHGPAPCERALGLGTSCRARVCPFCAQLGAPLQPPHLVHLVEHMKAVIALLGVDLTNPRRYPLRASLTTTDSASPLSRSTCAHAPASRVVNDNPNRYPVFHPRQHRLALAEQSSAPACTASSELRVEPRRDIGLDQHRSS